jgi:hypothetical protein
MVGTAELVLDCGVPWQSVVNSDVCGSVVPAPPHHEGGGFLGLVGILSSLIAALSIIGRGWVYLAELLWRVVSMEGRGYGVRWRQLFGIGVGLYGGVNNLLGGGCSMCHGRR